MRVEGDARGLLEIGARTRLADAMVETGSWRRCGTERVTFTNGEALHLAPLDGVPDELDVLWSAQGWTGDALLELGLALDCLWRTNPRLRARIIHPYLPYSRSTRLSPRSGLGARLVLSLVDAMPGVVEHVVLEPHSPEVAGFSTRPVGTIGVGADVALWAADLPVDVVVAPDAGRAVLCQDLAARLGARVEVLLKQRTGHDDHANAERLDRPTLRGARVLVVDDELTTGSTLTAAAHTAVRCGAAHVLAVVVRSFASAEVLGRLMADPAVGGLVTTELTPPASTTLVEAAGGVVIPVPGALEALRPVRHHQRSTL